MIIIIIIIIYQISNVWIHLLTGWDITSLFGKFKIFTNHFFSTKTILSRTNTIKFKMKIHPKYRIFKILNVYFSLKKKWLVIFNP